MWLREEERKRKRKRKRERKRGSGREGEEEKKKKYCILNATETHSLAHFVVIRREQCQRNFRCSSFQT